MATAVVVKVCYYICVASCNLLNKTDIIVVNLKGASS